jgi:hypothetical protein
MTKLQTRSLSNIRAVQTTLSFPRGLVLHIDIISSTGTLPSYPVLAMAGGYSTCESVFKIEMELQGKDGRSPMHTARPSSSPDVTPSWCRHLGGRTANGSWSRDTTERQPGW